MSHAPTFIDWFAGIGGFHLGLHLAGWRCAWAVEMEPFCRSVYAERFGRAPQGGMIQDVEGEGIPWADLWCGGFPCQGLSVAGKRGGLDDPRSGLWWEWMRLVDENRPPWLLIENVPGLLSSNDGEDFGLVLATLEHLGYRYAWRVLDARFFGVAQRRRRLFIVGHLDGEHPPALFLEPEGGEGDIEAGGQEGADIARAVGRSTGGVSGEEQQETFVVESAHRGANQTGVREGSSYPVSGTQAVALSLNAHPSRRYDGESETFILSDDQDEPLQQLGSDDRGPDAPAHAPTSEGHDAGEDGTGRGTPLVATGYSVIGSAQRSRSHAIRTEIAGALVGPPADPDRVREAPGLPGRVDLSVRGYENRPACRCADSPRYRALGNAVAVPVITWIGRRLREEMER